MYFFFFLSDIRQVKSGAAHLYSLQAFSFLTKTPVFIEAGVGLRWVIFHRQPGLPQQCEQVTNNLAHD